MMKRFFSVIMISAAMMAASLTASAQYFDHVALGIGVGFDGVSLQAATPVGNYIQLRLGGSYMPSFGYSFDVEDVEIQPNKYADLSLRGQANIKSFNAMLDLFPGRDTRFHFTAGLFAGPGHLATLYNTKPYLAQEDWGTAGIQIGNTLITTDDKGISKVNADVNKLMPYFGIGAGRAACDKNPVSFCFDFGACYSGGIGLYTKGTNIKTGQTDYIRITSADIAAAGADDDELIDKVGRYSKFLPVLKFSLFFRLF